MKNIYEMTDTELSDEQRETSGKIIDFLLDHGATREEISTVMSYVSRIANLSQEKTLRIIERKK